MDITEGLEVKVRLGQVWKQSLTELSGGQRSLIALSLIMSLLQFKPAPMYILDEVDAALDLQHTQHIGSLRLPSTMSILSTVGLTIWVDSGSSQDICSAQGSRAVNLWWFH